MGQEGEQKPKAAAEEVIEIQGDSSEIRKQLAIITKNVASGIEKSPSPSNDTLKAYAEVLKSIAEIEKTLPVNRKVTFSLSRMEIVVLMVYIGGGVILLRFLTFWLPGMGWKAETLVTVMLYWSTIFGILLGAQALPKLFGSTEGQSEKKSGAQEGSK